MARYCVFLFTLALAAQTGRNSGAGDTPTFKSDVRLVIETVTVRDKAGRSIPNLKAADFTLTEDGKAQEIRFFEHQHLEEAPAAPLIAVEQRAQALPRLTKSAIAPETEGGLKYRDRRLLALYFDLTAMPLPDQVRAFQAAQRFLKTQMTAADLVALMVYSSGSVQVLSDFTADRSKLLSLLETLIVGEDENAPAEPGDASKADAGAAFGQNDSEFNIFFTDRQLAALQTAAGMLGRLNEKKSLIYFASGLRLNGANNQAQLHATINAAIRAGVSLWPVDARGLMASAPLGDATQGSPGGQAMYTGAAGHAAATSVQRSQDNLWTLAADTGGKALLDSNDLARGIVEAQKANSDYYILGYYTTNAEPDGKFRRIKITLNPELSATLDYRQGYYAQRPFQKFNTADKERQLEEALLLQDPITELTIAMEVAYFQINRAEYFVPVAVKIPGSELALARRGGAEHTLIDFIGEIKDQYGSTISNVRDKVDIKLTGATVAELALRPIEYDTGFTLLPGRYRLKLLARDAETGRIGTFEMPFTVPNLMKEQQRLAVSSVVLSSQRVEMKEALFNASKDKAAQTQATNPLVLEGRKLIPSVTRVFSRAKDMYVYLQAYQPEVEAGQPVAASVAFYQDQRKVFETAPLAAAAGTNRLKTAPLQFAFPLEKLEPGEYTCQVTVVEPKSRKAAFWQAPVMIVP